jgi:hypothetical protein
MSVSPLAQIKPKVALLRGTPDTVSLHIRLAPFILYDDLVDTAIRLDSFSLPSLHLKELVGKTFAFPINPKEGYIDGSIYLASAHHAVDVTMLAFHLARDGGASVVLKGQIDFELEGEKAWGKWPFTFGVQVATCAV